MPKIQNIQNFNSLLKLDIKNKADKIFQYLCKNGHIDEAQWLLKIKPNINISANSECAFCCACENGHISVAQWLLRIKPDINIFASSDYAFCYACQNGHLNVAQWLVSIRPDSNIPAFDNCAFRCACSNSLEVAQWLLSIKPNINISADDDCAFYISCKRGRLNIAQWLCTLNSDYSIEIIDNRIIPKINKSLKIIGEKFATEIFNTECSFCLDENNDIAANCNHGFHKNCLQIWLNYGTNCPICKKEIKNIYKIISKF